MKFDREKILSFVYTISQRSINNTREGGGGIGTRCFRRPAARRSRVSTNEGSGKNPTPAGVANGIYLTVTATRTSQNGESVIARGGFYATRVTLYR